MPNQRRTVADIRATQPMREQHFSPKGQIVQDLAYLLRSHQALSVTLAALIEASQQELRERLVPGTEPTPVTQQLLNVALQAERVLQEMQ